MRYVEHLADAWAELWSTDGERAATLVYAREVVWWDVARGRGREAHGRAAVVAERDRLRAVAAGLRLTVVRAVPGHPAVAIEFVGAAPGRDGTVAAPGCAWWRLDDDGRICREQWFFDWASRRRADPTIAGHAVRGEGEPRSVRWARGFVTRLLEAWDADPVAAVDAFCAHDVIVDAMGPHGTLVVYGVADLRAAQARLASSLIERRTRIGEVTAADAVVACTHFTDARTATGPLRTTPVARVLTLDAQDKVVGDHVYLLRAWPRRGRR